MPNLRELAESDLATSLEGEFGLPVILTDPDGVEHPAVQGQVLYDRIVVEPERDMPILAKTPVVTLRRSTLVRVPQDGERWAVKIPATPSVAAPKVTYIFGPDTPTEGGASIGYIKLVLHEADSP